MHYGLTTEQLRRIYVEARGHLMANGMTHDEIESIIMRSSPINGDGFATKRGRSRAIVDAVLDAIADRAVPLRIIRNHSNLPF